MVKVCAETAITVAAKNMETIEAIFRKFGLFIFPLSGFAPAEANGFLKVKVCCWEIRSCNRAILHTAARAEEEAIYSSGEMPSGGGRSSAAIIPPEEVAVNTAYG